MASRQNGVRDQVSHSLENSQLQDLIVYIDGSVTKDQSSKVNVATIHEDSTAGLNLQLDDRGGGVHPRPPLPVCLKR